MSTLIDHYLLQLKSLLPASQRDDIARELGDSIRSTVDERERDLGRKLTDDELNTALRGFGHPLLVAGRYLPMQQLIGPDVFPIYWYVLQAVVIVIAVLGGVIAGIALLTEPRATQAAGQVVWRFFWIALDAAALVTLVFAVLDHEKVRFRFLQKFDARKISSGILGVRAAPISPIARHDTVFEIATVVVLLAWWLDWIVFPSAFMGVVLRLSPAIEPFFYPVIVLCAVDLVRLAVDFLYPYRTRPRVALRLVLNAAWLALFVIAFRADGLVQIAQNLRAGDPDQVLWIAQLAFRILLFVLALVSAGLVATDAVRLVRR